jgi:uncharacterized protein (TIGR02246 family)
MAVQPVRTLALAVVTVTFQASCAAGTADMDDEVRSLLATDREWAALAAVSRDPDSILAYWTEDARVVLAGQPVLSGKAAIREMIAGTMEIPGFRVTWHPDTAVVARSGDLAYTYGDNEFTAPDSTGELVTTRGRYLTVWRKEADGRWRCVEDYSSPAPLAAPPADTR